MRVINTIFFALVLLVNFLANYLPINGLTAKDVSDFYPSFFTPAPITFSIWGIIYLLVLSFVFYQLVAKSEKIDKITPYFILSCIANILWILSWHNLLIELSVIFIIVLLYSLAKIMDILTEVNLDKREKMFLYIPFSIYLAWIIVATVANITILLVHWNWSGFGLSGYFWVALVLIITSVIGIWRSWHDKNIFYSFVFIWALAGIYFANEVLLPIITVCILSFLISNFYLFKKSNSSKNIF